MNKIESWAYMSDHSDDEWRQYFLSKGPFANALRFAHLEKPEDADRTPVGSASDTLYTVAGVVVLFSWGEGATRN